MLCFKQNYTDDEATILMVDSKIQRENILLSEKAFAYKMKLEAMKHQGKKAETESAELVGKKAGDSGRTVQRYSRLTYLISQLLEYVDNGKLKFVPAISISYLLEEEQQWVNNLMSHSKTYINSIMVEKIKIYSQKKELTEKLVSEIVARKEKELKIILPSKKLKQYFPNTYNNK